MGIPWRTYSCIASVEHDPLRAHVDDEFVFKGFMEKPS